MKWLITATIIIKCLIIIFIVKSQTFLAIFLILCEIFSCIFIYALIKKKIRQLIRQRERQVRQKLAHDVKRPFLLLEMLLKSLKSNHSETQESQSQDIIQLIPNVERAYKSICKILDEGSSSEPIKDNRILILIADKDPSYQKALISNIKFALQEPESQVETEFKSITTYEQLKQESDSNFYDFLILDPVLLENENSLHKLNFLNPDVKIMIHSKNKNTIDETLKSHCVFELKPLSSERIRAFFKK